MTTGRAGEWYTAERSTTTRGEVESTPVEREWSVGQ
jgi:hypothetical protein